ncbi:MAG TPA: phosphoglucosamine mutase [Bryobacteraceae bacterium]|nr:phosphoglucosamine mutase [Bryobacteraceae bacterium]
MGKELFGTDGIRGVAGGYPLDAATVYAFGVALGDDTRKLADDPQILIGADTRESSGWLAETVAGGLESKAVRVRYAGVITTPGVAWLTRTGPFVAGVMISASHNPYQDNGLKVFGHSGFKLPDADEDAIEREIFALLKSGVSPRVAPLTIDEGLDRQYLDYLVSTVQTRFDGVKLAVDCGNGASFKLAPELLRRLGAKVSTMCTDPDGRNINQGCGALHLEGLAKKVVAESADFGVAFDGDADRAIFVSSSGKIVNGDGVLLAAGRALKEAGRLPGDTVVSTVMSNLGLEKALERAGIRMLRTQVGDKYVLEEMERIGARLGGEQSGHVIFRDFATTGDGLLTALRVFELAVRERRGLDELTADLSVYPQKLINIKVREKRPFDGMPQVASEIRNVERDLDTAGRVLVRYSGTELLARVMVEARDQAMVDSGAGRIADAIRREIGI